MGLTSLYKACIFSLKHGLHKSGDDVLSYELYREYVLPLLDKWLIDIRNYDYADS